METLKTPDEIKKEISETMEELSWVVEGGDAHDLQDACDKAHACLADTLALIEGLESAVIFHANIAKLNKKSCDMQNELIEEIKTDRARISENIKWMEAERDDLKRYIQQLEAERDAAVADLKELASMHGSCFGCKSYTGEHCGDTEYKIICSFHADKWQWRGVQKEEP